MMKSIRTLLFVLAICSCSPAHSSLLESFIKKECSTVPNWVVMKVITHESKTFNNGVAQPWPWTLNINSIGQYFKSFDDALLAAKLANKQGARRLGVGFGQTEWRYHSHRFNNDLANALNPQNNIRVVCEILSEAWRSVKVKSWDDAIAYYHRPVMDERSREYAKKVLAL